MRPRLLALLLLGIWSLNLLGPWGAHADESNSTPSRIEGALLQLLDFTDSRASLWAQEHGISLDPSGQYVRVIIEPEGRSSQFDPAPLRSLGGVIEAQSEHLLKARLPLRHLREIAQLSGISFIRRPYTSRPLRHIDYTTGTLPTGALLFHSYGFRGQGIKVAVIDAGFQGLSEAMRKGWIEPGVIYATKDYGGRGLEMGSDHGTRVARIVHEMAPEAQLVLMSLGEEGTEVELENAVRDAIRLGVRVINHSLGWFDTNFGDGTGIVDEIARRAYDSGILWVNAAGNQAAQHWTGLFQDRDGDGWTEFGYEREELVIWAGFGGVISLVLVWDDWPQTAQDLDLFLFNGAGEIVASSEVRQQGLDPPRESLDYLVENPGVYRLKVRAKRVSRAVSLKIFSLTSGHSLTPNTPHGSVIAPADCTCALAVGAVSSSLWEEGIVESFSARGPTSDGRIKPDLVAPDGVRGDFGTSFSAPHVAGAAALLLSQHPDWSLTQLWEAVKRNAMDLEPLGPDVESGAGKLQLVLGQPRALRSLSDSKVTVGESVTVRLAVRMPAALFGSLTLSEQLPAGFSLEAVDSGVARFTFIKGLNQAQWVWPTTGPGEAREVIYRLTISEAVEPGRYRLTGSINGEPIEGDEWLEILPRSSVTVQMSSRSILFQAKSSVLRSMQVQVFDLSGKERFDSGWVKGNRLAMAWGRSWANGVYFYVVTVRGANGQILTRQVKKFIMLR